jgi:hypothetical protein
LVHPDIKDQKEVIDTLLNKTDKVFRQWTPLNKKGKKLITMWSYIKIPSDEIINVGYDITKIKK